MPVLDATKLYQNRVDAIRKFHQDAHQPKAELDLSGGIDSAVMACLLVEALGKDNVLLVHTRINTDPKQTDRATRLAKALGAPFVDFDLTEIFGNLAGSMVFETEAALGKTLAALEVYPRVKSDPTIIGSIRSTLRAPIGRGFNRMFGGGIRHGTGNECEDRFLRFYQKGGDGEVDTNPIEMLSKTEVYQLAYHIYKMNLVENNVGMAWNFDLAQALKDTILTKPSPDLWGTGDAHNDEDELNHWTGVPFNYGRIDIETGKVVRFGTIERMARLLDVKTDVIEHSLGRGETHLKCPWGDILFSDEQSHLVAERVLDTLVVIADKSGCFPNNEFNPRRLFTPEEVKSFILAARKAERATRHKSNTNIPTLGTRKELVEAGILSNRLEV